MTRFDIALLQLRNFDTSIKKDHEAVKSLKQLQER